MRKGVSLVVIIATVAIIIIIVSTVTISYNNQVQDVSKKTFAKEIFHISTLVKEYEFLNDSYPVSKDININIQSDDFKDELGYPNIVLKEINLDKLNLNEVSRGYKRDGETDVYAISPTTNKIYYIKGYKVSDNIYYSLNDELEKLLDIGEVK